MFDFFRQFLNNMAIWRLIFHQRIKETCFFSCMTCRSKRCNLNQQRIRITIFCFLFSCFVFCCCFSLLPMFLSCTVLYFFFFFFFFFLHFFFIHISPHQNITSFFFLHNG